MDRSKLFGLVICLALLTASLGVPTSSGAMEPVLGDDDDILLAIVPIIAAQRNGMPEGSGNGAQEAAGPFFSSNGNLGGVVFNPVDVDVTLFNDESGPAIIWHVAGDTPFKLPIDNPPVQILSEPFIGLNTSPFGRPPDPGPIDFIGHGNRPLDGLTVPPGVQCTEDAEVTLSFLQRNLLAARRIEVFAKKRTAVVCQRPNGQIFDRIDGIRTEVNGLKWFIGNSDEVPINDYYTR